MKTKFTKFFAIALTGAVLTACTTNERVDVIEDISSKKLILNKADIKNASVAKQLEYKKYYLKEAAKLIKELRITSKDLVNLASSSTSKKQQKNTFLLEDIVAFANATNKNIRNENNKKLETLKNAFQGLEERNFAISIYIPFAEKLSNKGYSSTTAKLAKTQDIFIFEGQDNSSQLAFEGEILNEDGSWVTYEQLITEQMAEDLAEQGVTVAVVGLQDELIIEDPEAGGGGGGTVPAYPSTTSALVIKDMAIKTHKESWIAGESEVTIRGYRHYNGSNSGAFLWNGVFHGGTVEYIFKEVKRDDVRNQTMFNLNIPVTQRFTNNEVGIMYYVIYEADNWPANNYYAAPNGYDTIHYYSSDPAYISNFSQYSPYLTNYIENSEIKYRTTFY